MLSKGRKAAGGSLVEVDDKNGVDMDTLAADHIIYETGIKKKIIDKFRTYCFLFFLQQISAFSPFFFSQNSTCLCITIRACLYFILKVFYMYNVGSRGYNVEKAKKKKKKSSSSERLFKTTMQLSYTLCCYPVPPPLPFASSLSAL